MLRQSRVVTFAAFEEALEVSRATLKRDLEYLRSRVHFPVIYKREAGGYVLGETGVDTEKTHELPGLWFSSTEIHALLTMQHLLEGLDPGGVIAPHIEPLMRRLTKLLGSAKDDAREVRRRVHIIALARRPVRPEHFQMIGAALLQRKRLSFTYLARSNERSTSREVSPQGLVHYRENWYLDAWCHLRDDLRSFALDRINQPQMLSGEVKELDPEVFRAELNRSYGIFSGDKIEWAHLRFSPERARWVAREQWHPDQRSKTSPDGSYTLEVPYSDHRELIMDILKHGAHCEVLGPESLREAISKELCLMGQKYL
jgi:predicted DNA-binding transcriptional regulator YafY